ncbi:Cupredoxin [Coemansia mojavensis]|nr:Cupredoxin [Coemansia mojavensis]
MKLQPLVKKLLLTKINKSIVLKERMLPTGYGVSYFALGEASYAPALVPTLFSALPMGKLASNNAIYGAQVEPHVLRHMAVVGITIHCPGNRDHVFHAHGHSFQIMEFGPSGDASTANKSAYQVGKAGKWPMRHDSVLVKTLEYVKLRFRADNPGVWLLSEEVEAHSFKGQGINFIEAPEVFQHQQKTARGT